MSTYLKHVTLPEVCELGSKEIQATSTDCSVLYYTRWYLQQCCSKHEPCCLFGPALLKQCLQQTTLVRLVINILYFGVLSIRTH